MSLEDKQLTLARLTTEKLSPRLTTIGERLKDVHGVLSGINDDFPYRLGRSQYYTGKFRSGIKALRISRLEGFQPYGVFVERRMADANDFISFLAARYERAQADMNSLYQTNIAQTARLAEVESAETERVITNVQVVADKALFWVLLPYYFGHVAWEEVFRIPEGDKPRYWAYTWLFFFIMSAELPRRFLLFLWTKATMGLRKLFGLENRDLTDEFVKASWYWKLAIVIGATVFVIYLWSALDPRVGKVFSVELDHVSRLLPEVPKQSAHRTK